MDLQNKAKILGEQAFLGVPVKDFEKGGSEQLTYLLKAGLKPGSKVVDIGCGVLRAGYWLIHFLDPGCYFGIEPHTGRLNLGINTVLEPGLLEAKKPRFDTNPDFNTSIFSDKFDFFLAYSIWTHASRSGICRMLDGFLRDSKEETVFLATYLPADWRHSDYKGEKWFGTSHESDVIGCIYHSLRWIKTECRQRGLIVKGLGKDKTHGQDWIEIKRSK